MSIDSQEEEEKVVNISKNEDFNKEDSDLNPAGDEFSVDRQNPLENPSVIQNNSNEELFQSRSNDREKNESSTPLFSSLLIPIQRSPTTGPSSLGNGNGRSR